MNFDVKVFSMAGKNLIYINVEFSHFCEKKCVNIIILNLRQKMLIFVAFIKRGRDFECYIIYAWLSGHEYIQVNEIAAKPGLTGQFQL